jgi:hypothetical protein
MGQEPAKSFSNRANGINTRIRRLQVLAHQHTSIGRQTQLP